MQGGAHSLLERTHESAAHATGLLGVAVVVGLVLALAAVIALIVWRASRGESDDTDEADGWDNGGGGGGHPPSPPPSAPDWWPDFEREFADYVAKPQVLILPPPSGGSRRCTIDVAVSVADDG